VANLAFLTQFWSVIFLALSTLFGAKLVLSTQSLPILGPRVLVEIALNYAAALAVARADRSTIAFMRLLTIPLLLATDVTLGYHITPLQIAGVCVILPGSPPRFFATPTAGGVQVWELSSLSSQPPAPPCTNGTLRTTTPSRLSKSSSTPALPFSFT